MGNYGCCQGSSTIDQEKSEPIPEPPKPMKADEKSQIENIIEDPKLKEPIHHRKTKKKIHAKKSTHFNESVTVLEKPMQKETFKFNTGGFVHLTHGDIAKSYTIISNLGKGSFGSVYKALHKHTESLRSIKVVKKENLSTDLRQKLLQEVEILKSLDHPNILKIFEVFEDDKSFSIVTEICSGGELFERIIASRGFSENKAAIYLYQIMSGVLTCHEKGIVHRDLKPENILFSTEDEDSALKIIDFGTSKKMEPNTTLTSLTGTVKTRQAYYIAPEVISGSYDYKYDI